MNLHESITKEEARVITGSVTVLAAERAFTHLEAMQIGRICMKCFERLKEKESNEKKEITD
jgi:hypothetical protein